MKKNIDIASITNELEGASLFFTRKATPPPAPPEEPKTPDTNTSPLSDSPFFEKNVSPAPNQNDENQDQKRTFERTNEGTNERPKKEMKREIIRHTFDIYKDQLFALQMIQLQAVQAGKKKPKLGKMVSEGIDLYLKHIASKKKQG